jgi:hypothetical protein
MRASLWCLGTALVILAGLAGRASASTSGQITINLMDFAGGGIGPGAQVEGDLWGVSRPKGGSGYTWHHLRKDATATAGGSAVTWTTGEIDAAVDLDANDFWFAVTGWGGQPLLQQPDRLARRQVVDLHPLRPGPAGPDVGRQDLARQSL